MGWEAPQFAHLSLILNLMEKERACKNNQFSFDESATIIKSFFQK
jgi:hypothetical protein